MGFDKGVCQVCEQERTDLDDWIGVCVDCMFKMDFLNISPEEIRAKTKADIDLDANEAEEE